MNRKKEISIGLRVAPHGSAAVIDEDWEDWTEDIPVRDRIRSTDSFASQDRRVSIAETLEEAQSPLDDEHRLTFSDFLTEMENERSSLMKVNDIENMTFDLQPPKSTHRGIQSIVEEAILASRSAPSLKEEEIEKEINTPAESPVREKRVSFSEKQQPYHRQQSLTQLQKRRHRRQEQEKQQGVELESMSDYDHAPAPTQPQPSFSPGTARRLSVDELDQKRAREKQRQAPVPVPTQEKSQARVMEMGTVSVERTPNQSLKEVQQYPAVNVDEPTLDLRVSQMLTRPSVLDDYVLELQRRMWSSCWKQALVHKAAIFDPAFQYADKELPLGVVLPPRLSTSCAINPGTCYQEFEAVEAALGREGMAKAAALENDEVCLLFRQLEDIEGCDVYWDGVIDDEATMHNLTALPPLKCVERTLSSYIRCAPTMANTSISHFGKLSVTREPYMAIFEFDDRPERLVFSLVQYAYRSKEEQRLMKKRMKTLIELNRQPEVVYKKTLRQKLRLVSCKKQRYTFHVETESKRRHVSGTVVVGTKKLDDPDVWKDNTGELTLEQTRKQLKRASAFESINMSGSFVVFLDQIEEVVEKRRLSVYWANPKAVQGKTSSSICNFVPEMKRGFHVAALPLSFVEWVHEHVSDEEVQRYNEAIERKRRQRINQRDQKAETFPLSAYLSLRYSQEVHMDTTVSAVQQRCKEDLKLESSVAITETAAALQYIAYASAREQYWFCFWYIVQHLDDWKEVLRDNDMGIRRESLVYQCHQYDTLESLSLISMSSASFDEVKIVLWKRLQELEYHYTPIEQTPAPVLSNAKPLALSLLQGHESSSEASASECFVSDEEEDDVFTPCQRLVVHQDLMEDPMKPIIRRLTRSGYMDAFLQQTETVHTLGVDPRSSLPLLLGIEDRNTTLFPVERDPGFHLNKVISPVPQRRESLMTFQPHHFRAAKQSPVFPRRGKRLARQRYDRNGCVFACIANQ